VDVIGCSTGGAIALNFAADHPGLVRRLVIAGAAHRLSATGNQACRQAAELFEAGSARAGLRAMLPATLPTTASTISRRVMAAVQWLLAPVAVGRNWNPSDAVITLRAELSIALDHRLKDIVTPTLIIGGANDASYPPEVTAELEAGLPRAYRIVYKDTGHGVILNKRFGEDVHAFLTAPDKELQDGYRRR
jgi:pimeloyl-ACP methyl ester carboxylesterase